MLKDLMCSWLNAPQNLLKGQFEMVVHIDERANNSQFNALRKAYHGGYGGHLGVSVLGKELKKNSREYLPTKRAKITYMVNSPTMLSSRVLLRTKWNNSVEPKVVLLWFTTLH